MRFVDHQQITRRRTNVPDAAYYGGRNQRADHQLLGFKRVIRVVPRFGIAFVSNSAKRSWRAAFYQPLVLRVSEQ